MLHGSVGGFWSNDAGGQNRQGRWNVNARPGALYFVRDDLGLGGSLGVGYSEIVDRQVVTDAITSATETMRASVLELASSVDGAVAFPVHARWSVLLWPSIGYVFLSSRAQGYRLAGPNSSDPVSQALQSRFHRKSYAHMLRVGVDCSFIYSISSAVGVGVGPDFALDLELPGWGSAGLHGLLFGLKAGVYASF
jgi:hypothetical protein